MTITNDAELKEAKERVKELDKKRNVVEKAGAYVLNSGGADALMRWLDEAIELEDAIRAYEEAHNDR